MWNLIYNVKLFKGVEKNTIVTKGDRLTYSSSTNAGMDAGVFVLSNNTNSQVVIRNVRQYTPTQLSFEVFPTNDIAYLFLTIYYIWILLLMILLSMIPF